jgi:MFS family permease
MKPGFPSGMGLALAWFAFPLVPTLLGTTYHQQWNEGGEDPRDWGWLTWLILTGPLIGYGFLAGATIDLPDDPAHRGPSGWLLKRSLWVGVGPWVGFLASKYLLYTSWFVQWAYPPSLAWSMSGLLEGWFGSWFVWLPIWLYFWGLGMGGLAYGWLFVAWAALRRAWRLGRLRRSLAKGLAVAIGFVGSLFGSFWAITETWRAYFFDARIAPMLVAALSLGLMSGCAKTLTYGEVRRRELFQSMLMAWLLGLALAWRWWSRSRPKPPGASS